MNLGHFSETNTYACFYIHNTKCFLSSIGPYVSITKTKTRAKSVKLKIRETCFWCSPRVQLLWAGHPSTLSLTLRTRRQKRKYRGCVGSLTFFPALWSDKMLLNRSSAWKRIKSKRKIASVIISEHLICHLLYDICMRLV